MQIPQTKKCAHLFFDCGCYNCFRFFENNYTWSSYFRLDSTFHSTLRFSTCVPQRFATEPPAIQDRASSDSRQILREEERVRSERKFLAPNVEVGGERWRQAIGNWHSTHATRGKRRRFAPPFPPSCIRRGLVREGAICVEGRKV